MLCLIQLSSLSATHRSVKAGDGGEARAKTSLEYPLNLDAVKETVGTEMKRKLSEMQW